MKIILALVMMHCQNYFNYELCVEETVDCITTYSTHKPVIEPQVLVGEQELKLARAYLQCVDPLENE